jgi:O-antigen/teichoic acid export membrane protein
MISDGIDRFRGTTLKTKIIRGTAALSVGAVAERGVRLVRNMVLARILAPDQFGPMAIIMAVSLALEAFTEVGIKQSVIQNERGSDPNYLNVAWWMQTVRGLIIFLAAAFAAPWASSFYGRQDLARLLQVSLLSIVFMGLVSPRAYILEREYQFGRRVLLVQGSTILGTLITVALAFVLRNVWALVIGFVSESAILCILSYILVPYRPRFEIDRACLSELLRFARGMFGLPILTVVATKTDIIVLGKMVPDEQLGMYSLAFALAHTPIMLFAQIFNPMILPTFARQQTDTELLAQTVLRATQLVAVLTLPLIAFMTSCSSGILQIIYVPQYVAVAVPFGILCLLIFTWTEGVILGSVYMAVGKPELHRRFVILRAAIIVSLIYPAIIFAKLEGAAAVLVLASLVALWRQVFWCQRIINFKTLDYLRCFVPGLFLGLAVLAAVNSLRLLGISSNQTMLIAGILISAAVFLAGLWILTRTGTSCWIQKENPQ